MDRTIFWERVNVICEIFHCSVTSGYRTKEHNAAVGGVPNSRHLTGNAADIVLQDPTTQQPLTALAAIMHIRVIDELAAKGHLHLDVEPLTQK